MTDAVEEYEAVVVGCGPGGAAAAATLARNGVETLVLERGVDAGSKNVSGGLIYAEESAPYTIDGLFPDFREEATERPVTENLIHNIAGDKVKSFDIGDLHHHDTAWADAVLRRKMDSWLAQQVHERTRETGGGLLTEVHVTGLLRERGEIVGVTTEELDPIKADIVVAADGVNSELARDAGLMDWEEPEEWFQGVKAVVDMEPELINDRFDVAPDDGAAHLFSGDLFDGVRGGGFLYTNESSLSIGTVFHLDSIAEERAEPHELLDSLLTHPLMAQWLGDEYDEREYSAKLVPDSKKAAHPSPHTDRLVLVGDAAGQMQAQGPIIKGMNHAVTAGALAAEAFADARARGDPSQAGELYEKKLHDEGVMDKLQPTGYKMFGQLGEVGPVDDLSNAIADSAVGRFGVRAAGGLLERAYSSPRLISMIPDTKLPYVTLPTVIAEELGEPVAEENTVSPPDLADRIGDLTYDVDDPHIELLDKSFEASGTAVTACPVSAEDFGGGCYRDEMVQTNGSTEHLVSLDTQPCVECGTCAIVADTEWEHPAGGKGVEFNRG
ncbi:electron transfer flavoprotein-quinone oxidoreductase [Haloarcula vallismortis]|uniref:Flavoprotein n=2 Tax=Haloarcula vallismortis TaxID=28442 RepID=M0JF36_HALVA|nr:FAD-dependent monooxygenase [Haloarcula vallismortis]EMA07752.1 flavoprotein [Haloarcula vallismortis ATCC 29715]SDW72114.1 electron transfer flavoprotein-quinone oxidoreductase [Haloarcula vallismortis]